MALNRKIARLTKILVDSERIAYSAAQKRLESLTLEVVVGNDAISPAAQAAVLTAISVGRRTFVGGIRIRGAIDLPLNTSLPFKGKTLGSAAAELRSSEFKNAPARRIYIGASRDAVAQGSVAAYWNGWCAGVTTVANPVSGAGENPLAGIAAGALAVGAAFQAERNGELSLPQELNLWPVESPLENAPDFSEVFLPGALWIIGLGNLGQAYLWALSSLPYADARKVKLVLQDRDRVTEENWATSVLVFEESYQLLKTKVGEAWCEARGFDVRRVDRMLMPGDRLANDDPRLALSGVDKIAARKIMADIGFEYIIDTGLGRTASHFDQYRVSLFDNTRRIDRHFSALADPITNDTKITETYRGLAEEIGLCGAAEIAGASVAAPYVSAVAAAVAVSRAIAVASGCSSPANEVGRISQIEARRNSPHATIEARGVGHCGRPKLK